MLDIKVGDTDRMAFPGFIFNGYFWETDCRTYTRFKLLWIPNMKEEFGQDKDAIHFEISMN